MNAFTYIYLYIISGGITLVFLSMFNSRLFKLVYNAPDHRTGNLGLAFLFLAWPFAILLYILLTPVLMVKGIIYTFKGRKEWL